MTIKQELEEAEKQNRDDNIAASLMNDLDETLQSEGFIISDTHLYWAVKGNSGSNLFLRMTDAVRDSALVREKVTSAHKVQIVLYSQGGNKNTKDIYLHPYQKTKDMEGLIDEILNELKALAKKA